MTIYKTAFSRGNEFSNVSAFLKIDEDDLVRGAFFLKLLIAQPLVESDVVHGPGAGKEFIAGVRACSLDSIDEYGS